MSLLIQVSRTERIGPETAADCPRVSSQRSGLRGFWIFRLRWPVRARCLHKSAETGWALRRCSAALRSYFTSQRSEHRGLRLLSGSAVDRCRWSALGSYRGEASFASEHNEDSLINEIEIIFFTVQRNFGVRD